MPRDRPPSLWESLKRALAGVERPPGTARPPQVEEKAATAPEAAAPPPFLSDEPPSAPVAAAGEPLPEPLRANSVEDAAPLPDSPPESDVPPAGRSPRLARGLASFSKSNADRERKFAHLLHDDPSGEKKKR